MPKDKLKIHEYVSIQQHVLKTINGSKKKEQWKLENTLRQMKIKIQHAKIYGYSEGSAKSKVCRRKWKQ